MEVGNAGKADPGGRYPPSRLAIVGDQRFPERVRAAITDDDRRRLF